METAKFEANTREIEERAKIVPYGRANKQYLQEPIAIEFKLYNTEKNGPVETEENSTIYKASTFIYASMLRKIQGEVSVRITNIPTSITQPELLEIVLKKIRDEKCVLLAIKPFNRLNLVLDRETRASRGFAYANCENTEKAKELAKIIRSIVLDACVLGAEILENSS